MLPPAQREALILVGAGGFAYEEAADICGCAVGTVKSRINRARNLLKRMLLGEAEAKHALRAPPMRARAQRKPTPALVRQGAGEGEPV